MATKKLTTVVIDALEDIKARDIKLINVAKLTSVFDYIAIASADSTRQTKALAKNVMDKVRENGGWIYGIEGEQSGEWVLVDCGDIVVHIMQPAMRELYELEELWGEGSLEFPPPKAAPKRAVRAVAPQKVAPKTAAKAKVVKVAKPKVAAKKKSVVVEPDKKIATKKLVARKPVAKKPAVNKPVAKKPVAKKPAAKKVVAKQPVAKTPMEKGIAAKKPASKKPVAKKPTAKKPVAKPPAAKKPVSKKPAAKKPVTVRRKAG